MKAAESRYLRGKGDDGKPSFLRKSEQKGLFVKRIMFFSRFLSLAANRKHYTRNSSAF